MTEPTPDTLRAAYIDALDEAHHTHPCPVTGRPYWLGCVHYNEAGRVTGVGSCHSERRADAVLAVRDQEMEKLRAELDRVRANRDYWRGRYRAESLTTWSTEVPPGGEVCADCGEPVESEPCAEHNPAAVAEQLRAELAKYVGKEPTIAEEMAYLSRCLDAVRDVCDQAERQATRWEQPLPVPEWVATVRAAVNGLCVPATDRPALPWAHAMDDHDLHLFLDDLVSAALGRWQTGPDDEPIPDRDVLTAVEKACADWRTPGQGYRSDEPGTGEQDA